MNAIHLAEIYKFYSFKLYISATFEQEIPQFHMQLIVLQLYINENPYQYK